MKSQKQRESVPLTKRLLERSAVKAGKIASESAMKTAGYVIKVEDDWLVREDASGVITKISELKKTTQVLKLD